jgi:small subunit ribosomal protein S8e
VTYNSTNNELVRTNTLVKNSIIQIDATPFRQWYEQHYGVSLGAKKAAKKDEKAADGKDAKAATEEVKKRSASVQAKIAKRVKGRVIDPAIEDQFNTGRLYACIASRPGQSGRADGYVLEGPELAFYLRKMQKTKKGKKE